MPVALHRSVVKDRRHLTVSGSQHPAAVRPCVVARGRNRSQRLPYAEKHSCLCSDTWCSSQYVLLPLRQGSVVADCSYNSNWGGTCSCCMLQAEAIVLLRDHGDY